MKIIPAIDIKNGKCVRLFQGDFSAQTIYSDNPVAIAQKWEEEGAQMLHIVDLDGAKNGEMKNVDIVTEIVKSVSIPIEVGGGIRTFKDIKKLINLKVARIVIGTVALENEKLLQEILKNFGEKIVVALESKNDMLMKKGWVEATGKNIFDTALLLEKMGVKRFLITDITKDGTMTHPNFELITKLKKILTIPFIVSGGISSIKDIKKLKEIKVDEVIMGKALYEGKFTIKEAINAF